MFDQKKLIVSHAPFWHIGNRVTQRSYHTMLAALPAVIAINNVAIMIESP